MVNSGLRFTKAAAPLSRSLTTAVKASTLPQKEDRLYRRLSALGHIKGTVAKTVNEYIREGASVQKFDLDACVQELRRYRRYNHALELMEWMEFRKFNFARKDYAVRLDLIAKVHGIVAAENYFTGLSPSVRSPCTYGALLNCYCVEKMRDKAANIFAKMVEDKMVKTPLPVNNLMSLCIRLEQPDKVALLREEMKTMNIQPDTFTFNLLMRSYSSLNDIDGVERVFEELKRDYGSMCNWTTYSSLAIAYIAGGHREKAKVALGKLEEEMPSHDREAYHFLISLYAQISDLHNVHRIWKSLKSNLRVVTNKSYLIMLQGLRNLDDIKGMEKCFGEWESVCSHYDLRLANVTIGAYLQHDMLQEAELIVQNALNKSSGPFFKTWDLFMIFFLKNSDVERALRMMDIASSEVSSRDFCPKPATLERFLDDFNKEHDANSVEELYGSMKRIAPFDSPLYKSLLRPYFSDGRTLSLSEQD